MVQLRGFKKRLVLNTVHLALIAAISYAYYDGQQRALNIARLEGHKNIQQQISEEQQSLELLSTQVGQLMADVTRLNALGQRLVSIAKLDPEEFDFTTMPGLGDESYGTESLLNLTHELGELGKRRIVQLTTLADLIYQRTGEHERSLTGKGWPVKRGWVSSNYGHRIDPINGRRRFHAGIDIAAPKGDPLFALAGGVVTWAGTRAGYGNLIEIDHGDDLKTRYGHVQKVKVELGQIVRKGQQIAEVGQTGRATGPHVHLEVRKRGETHDPKQYFAFK